MQSQYLKDLLVAVIVTAYVTWYNDSFSEFPTYYNAWGWNFVFMIPTTPFLREIK